MCVLMLATLIAMEGGARVDAEGAAVEVRATLLLLERVLPVDIVVAGGRKKGTGRCARNGICSDTMQNWKERDRKERMRHT